jgi:pyridinium-3,5-biscarboxylic acid mononucleotide synthase
MDCGQGFCELGFAKVDTDRLKRRGVAEAVFCRSKSIAQIKEIVRELLSRKQDVILTKLEKNAFRQLSRAFPKLKYNDAAQIGYYTCAEKKVQSGRYILVVCAGTSDVPIAEEAVVTAMLLGNRVEKLYDVGVAGVHRLMQFKEKMSSAAVIIVVAGMEGALASVVSGLVACPVIAVPTSCGYGANFQGLSALLTMLNCCSPGVAVMNIDNGFGAGYFASLILRKSTGPEF